MMIYRIFMYFGSVFLVLVCFTLAMEPEPPTSTSTTMDPKTQSTRIQSPLSIGPGGTLTESLSLTFATSASLPHLMKIFKGNVPVDIRNLVLTKLTERRCCMLWKFIHEQENKTEDMSSYGPIMAEAWKSKRFSYSMFVKTELTL